MVQKPAKIRKKLLVRISRVISDSGGAPACQIGRLVTSGRLREVGYSMAGIPGRVFAPQNTQADRLTRPIARMSFGDMRRDSVSEKHVPARLANEGCRTSTWITAFKRRGKRYRVYERGRLVQVLMVAMVHTDRRPTNHR